MYLEIGTFLRNDADTIDCVGEWISYKHKFKNISLKNNYVENNLGDDCKKMYVTSIISGSKAFLEKLLLPKDRQFIY